MEGRRAEKAAALWKRAAVELRRREGEREVPRAFQFGPPLSLRKIKMAGAAADRRRIREGRSKERGERRDGRTAAFPFGILNILTSGEKQRGGEAGASEKCEINPPCMPREGESAREI